jgi:hypothetical protein
VIIKGSQRGGGQDLADHLMNTIENDHFELHEMRGFASTNLAGAFLEIELAASLTRCTQPFYSVIYNPPKGHNATIEDFEEAMRRTEDEFPELKGQPRIVMFHEKEGRLHSHGVWSRIDCERGRAVNLSHTWLRLQDVSRAMYAHMGIEAPAGFRDHAKADPLNYDIGVWQQAKRLGEDPRDLKRIIQDAWSRSDDRASFEHALEQNAMHLARGDRRGFVVVHQTGAAMSLTRYGGIGTRDLKARLGEPEHLRTVDQVRTMLTEHTTAAVMRRGREWRDRHREQLRPLADEHRNMKKVHQQQRQALAANQTKRAKREAEERAARLRKGIMGLWDRLSGTRGKVSELNARDMQAGKVRDRADKQTLHEIQMQERGELQARIMQMRERHRHDRQQHRAELALMLSMISDSVRDTVMDHGDDMDALSKPPTAEKARRDRRDRAEKRGTMPEIVASERTRRRDARRDREARISGAEGQETATGETAPENEQAPTAPPEATAGHDLEQGQQPPAFPPSTGASLTQVWTKQQRAAEINAQHERQEQQQLNRSNDNQPPGRTFEP